MRYDHFSMLPERAFQKRPSGGMTLEGGGGGGPTQTNVTQTNIPEWLRPQTEALLGAATQEYFQTKPVTKTDPETGETTTTYDITGIKPFTPYSTRPEDYVAGFSPIQQQMQFEAANMMRPGQFADATNLAGIAATGGLGSAQQAMGYGGAGFQSGMLGQQVGMQAAQQAEQRARAAEQAGYGYGQAGYQSGALGQQLGISGGEYYGGLGAGYGAQAAGLAPFAQQYGQIGSQLGLGAAGLVPEATGYGRTAADIGQMGLRAEALGRDVGEEARMFARQAAGMGGTYERMATDPRAVQAYMSPYMQAVVETQKEAAIRDAQKANLAQNLGAVRTGTYGGARQALAQTERERALQSQLSNIQAQGLQKAYEDALRAQQFGVTTGLQGLQGAQAGLGTALQGGQLGLSGIGQAIAGQQAGLAGLGQAGQLYGQGISGQQAGLAGLGQAGQLYGLGMQGAGMGLQGVQQQLAGTAQGMQGAQVGLSGIDRALAAGQLSLQGTDRALAGTAQGMQGAQVGLQGVSGAQAGYGLAGQQATSLANIAQQQQAADLARMQFQGQVGAEQQAREQSIINQAIQNYAQAQQTPFERLAGYNALLRGYATPVTTTQSYQAAPSPLSQLAGLGTAGAAMYGLAGGGRKKGGKIKEKDSDGIDELMIRKTMKKVAA